MEAGRESRVRGEVAACSRLLCRIDLGGGGWQTRTGRTNRLPTVWDGAPDQWSEDLAEATAERACNEAHGNPKALAGGSRAPGPARSERHPEFRTAFAATEKDGKL